RAGAALAGLAVPADRQVRRLGGLQPVDDVEDDLALVHLDGEVLQRAVVVGAAPHPELRLVAHYFSPPGSSSAVRYFVSSSTSKRLIRSSRIGICSRRVSSISSPLYVQASRTLRQSADIFG